MHLRSLPRRLCTPGPPLRTDKRKFTFTLACNSENKVYGPLSYYKFHETVELLRGKFIFIPRVKRNFLEKNFIRKKFLPRIIPKYFKLKK